MLYRYSEVFRSGLMVVDLMLVASCWLGAYWVLWRGGVIPRETSALGPYIKALLGILPLWWQLFRSRGLYEPRRSTSLFPEVGNLLGAQLMGVMILLSVGFFYPSFSYSRAVVALFFVLSNSILIGQRIGIRSVLRSLRRRGINQRFAVVVGPPHMAAEVIQRLRRRKETGLRVIAAFSNGFGQKGQIENVPIRGGYGELKSFLKEQERVDEVILALSRDDMVYFEKILTELEDETATLRIVPDLFNVLTLRSSVSDLDGLPIIALREGPLVGWDSVTKRIFDLSVASFCLLSASPLLAVISLAIWVNSGRPIFYAQERVGLDNRVFRMWKFRTMKHDAEGKTDPVFAVEGDPRLTRVGRVLRKTGFDELPQLWNVLRGDMSLVGPRPERPYFIEQFRSEIPGYMLRHKIKAGLTGWAQIHGWRGNTSISERVAHDIYYIQNWSFALDVRILCLTLWRGLVRRKDYYRNAY